jgi:hypothetical protein
MQSSRGDKKLQRRQYQLTRSNLQPRQLLGLVDFTCTYLTPKIGHQQASTTVQDCIVVFEFMEGGERKRINLDYLCDCADTNKNDYHFMLHVWLKLFHDYQINERFDMLIIWTDGGPHHFKTRYCQWMWHFLSTYCFDKKTILHNFFASYHGHSLADSHAAAIKKALHTQYNTSQIQRFSPTASALYWGPSNATEFAALLAHACANTHIHVFSSIDRDPKLKPDVSSIKHIKSQHCFVYQDGLCASAATSSSPGSTCFSLELKS